MILQDALQPDAEIREVFQEVLTQPDFQYAGTSPLILAIGAVLDWIRNLVSSWFPSLGDAEARVISWVLLGACVLFALHLLMQRFRLGPQRRAGRDAGHAPPLDAPRDADGWMEWARAAAGAGRLRDAATGVYQSTILSLDARGALRYREWKTPGDYALEVSAPEVRPTFLDFLDRFVAVAFGPGEPSREAYDALSDRSAHLGGPV